MCLPEVNVGDVFGAFLGTLEGKRWPLGLFTTLWTHMFRQQVEDFLARVDGQNPVSL